MKLSLAMIVRDAEATLARALASVAGLCDEVIVVDTGSVDGSKEIAAHTGAKVFDFQWTDDFSAARNFSFQHCTADWILWLDADDVIPPASQQRLLNVKESVLSGSIDAVYLPYQYAFNAANKCELTLYRERILRRDAEPEWNYPVHERVQVPIAQALHLHDIFVEHRPSAEHRAARDPARNLKIIEKAFSSGGEQCPRMLFYYANELYDNNRFDEAIAAYKEFLNSEGHAWERYWALRRVSICYAAMGQMESALSWGLRAIEEDSARAEAFNDVGIIHYREKRITEALPYFWGATRKHKPQTCFVEDAHYEWLPYDYLSSCYMNMGDYSTAMETGRRALLDNPRSERLQENIEFLTKLVT